MLLKIGFHQDWIRNVMTSVRSVRYQMTYNNHVTECIIPERGLRQGDPLSPYLFIICSEWLSWMITKSQYNRKFDGIRICTEAPTISQLFFADDSLFFFCTNKRSIEELKRIMSLYEGISGQKINFDKSELCLSRNSITRPEYGLPMFSTSALSNIMVNTWECHLFMVQINGKISLNSSTSSIIDLPTGVIRSSRLLVRKY